MDRGIWATWYDLPEQGKEDYISWLHEVHIPEMLSRPGYLWAAHVEIIPRGDMEQYFGWPVQRPEDPSVPTGSDYLMLYGAASPHTFVDPSPAEMEAKMTAETREMLGRRIGSRSCIFAEAARVDGPEAHTRAPGITLAPAIQLGSYNVNPGDSEEDQGTWYARHQLPRMAKMPGCVGARKLVSISGWAKHASLYEFVSFEAINTRPPLEEFPELRARFIHAPGSPCRGRRIWPPA